LSLGFVSLSPEFVSAVSRSNFTLQIKLLAINEMPKTKPLQDDQLPLDELLPDAPANATRHEVFEHKPAKKPLKKQALYRTRKD